VPCAGRQEKQGVWVRNGGANGGRAFLGSPFTSRDARYSRGARTLAAPIHHAVWWLGDLDACRCDQFFIGGIVEARLTGGRRVSWAAIHCARTRVVRAGRVLWPPHSFALLRMGVRAGNVGRVLAGQAAVAIKGPPNKRFHLTAYCPVYQRSRACRRVFD
jgi:hypothetical protein